MLLIILLIIFILIIRIIIIHQPNFPKGIGELAQRLQHKLHAAELACQKAKTHIVYIYIYISLSIYICIYLSLSLYIYIYINKNMIIMILLLLSLPSELAFRVGATYYTPDLAKVSIHWKMH